MYARDDQSHPAPLPRAMPRLRRLRPLSDRARIGLGRAPLPYLRARADRRLYAGALARALCALVVLAAAAALSLAHAQSAGTIVTLPSLVFATPSASVWHFEAGYDPVFPNECDPPAALEAMRTSGPAQVFVTSCHYTPADGLRVVMVVHGPRCRVTWEGVPIEQRHCSSLPLVKSQ
jgi:hypothetical protein